MLKGPNREEYEVAIQLRFTTSNNEVEYDAMIGRINMVREMGMKNLEVMSDS
jgi:ribonuclease HI